MPRKCRHCLCRTCINSCQCRNCNRKIKECSTYIKPQQLNIFEQPSKPKNQKTPRYPWSHYGISKERYRQLTEYIRSGRYDSLASQAAHTANKDISEHILLSVTRNLSYEGLEKLWGREEIERIPYCRTDFYGIRRCFYSIFDKEIRRIGK